jgi:two-component system sensor histidine kinase UhpB
MREEMKEALAELRRTVTALRTPLEAAEGAPLNTALTRLAQSFQDHTGLTVHCDLSDSLPPLPEAHRLALYRAAQESLTNTQRHASAKQVWLALSAAQGHVTLTAADDGKGFGEHAETSGGNYGLRGLRERAAQLGGELILEDRQGGGAQVRFSLPWREAPHA